MEKLKIFEENSRLTFEEQMEEWDETISDVGEALRSYIRTGKKSEQLSEAEDWIKRYRRTLEEMLKAKGLVEWLEVDSKKFKGIKKYQEQLHQQYIQISVASQLSALVALSIEETAQREQERGFEQLRRDNRDLDRIVKVVFHSPYQEIGEISRKLSKKVSVVQTIIERCENLFSVRSGKNNSCLVALSSEGYSYIKTQPLGRKKYSQHEMEMALVNHSMEILEHLQKGKPYSLRVEDPEQNRLFSKKYRAVKVMIDKRRELADEGLFSPNIRFVPYNQNLQDVKEEEDCYGIAEITNYG